MTVRPNLPQMDHYGCCRGSRWKSRVNSNKFKCPLLRLLQLAHCKMASQHSLKINRSLPMVSSLLVIIIILTSSSTCKLARSIEVSDHRESGEATNALLQFATATHRRTISKTLIRAQTYEDNQTTSNSIKLVDSLSKPIVINSSTNNSSNDATKMSGQEDEGSIISRATMIANMIICVIGMCGNSIVILVILKFTRIETVTDIYILNLAFADLMFLTGLIFLITTMLIEHWIFGNLMCKMYMATTSLNQFASSLLLVVMSFDRYLAVCHPIYAQTFRRPERAKQICSLIWVVCLVLMTPIFLFAKINNELTCGIFWPDSQTFNCELAFTMYSFAIGFSVPLFLIAVSYLCVVRELRMSAKKNIAGSRRSKTRENTNRRIELLVIGIIFTYTICWLPYWIEQLCVSFSTPETIQFRGFYDFVLIATSLSYTNSALNPILYAFLSDNFKRRCSDIFNSIFKWLRLRRRFNNNNNTTNITITNIKNQRSHNNIQSVLLIPTAVYSDPEVSRAESRQTVLLNESSKLTSSSLNTNHGDGIDTAKQTLFPSCAGLTPSDDGQQSNKILGDQQFNSKKNGVALNEDMKSSFVIRDSNGAANNSHHRLTQQQENIQCHGV